MPTGFDPETNSGATQYRQSFHEFALPNAYPPGRVRAKLTADDGGTPKNFAWIKQIPDANGNLQDDPDGLQGTIADAQGLGLSNPARELNDIKPPSYPWNVWLEPRGNAQDVNGNDIGTVFDFALDATSSVVGVCTPIITNIDFVHCTYTIRYAFVISISDNPC